MADTLFDKGWQLVAAGLLMVAVGGAAATLGWNNISRQRQASSLLAAVKIEWQWNDTTFNYNSLFISNDDSLLGAYELYPRFRDGAISNLLASGLFARGEERDSQLLSRISDYQESIRYMNRLFDVSDDYVLRAEKDSIVAHRRYVQKSKKLEDFGNVHTRFGVFLDSLVTRS